VIVFDAHAEVTPEGRPVAVPMPVAPVVAIVILGDNAVLIHNVGDEEGLPAVFAGVTVIVPVAFILPHPPVNGML
jgi:hypothetical protein